MEATDDLQKRTEATAELFQKWVLDRGHQITVDGRVCEAVAADLTGTAPRTLANYRSAGIGPVFFKTAGRITYRIIDLAQWIEASREDTLE